MRRSGASGMRRDRIWDGSLPLLLLLLSVGASVFAVAQDTTAGAACQAVLNAGVYNTFRTSMSGSTYYQAHQAACSDYSSYTYDQYLLDTSSAVATGNAATLNAAAKAFSWGSVSTSMSSARYFQSAGQFNEAKTKAAAYRATNCGASSVTSVSDTNVQTLSQFIEPAVYQAYISCINLYVSGVRVTQTSGFASKSVSLDIRFVPNQAGATAYLTGISMYPPGAATCTVFRPGAATEARADAAKASLASASEDATVDGADAAAVAAKGAMEVAAIATPPPSGTTVRSPPSPPRRLPPSPPRRSPPPRPPRPPPVSRTPPPPPATPFQFQLIPNAVYSVFCSLAPGAPIDSRYTDINIYTSASGTFHALLFNDPAPTQLAAAFERISALEAALQANVSSINSRMAVMASDTNNRFSVIETRVRQRASRVQTGTGMGSYDDVFCTESPSTRSVKVPVTFPVAFATTPTITVSLLGTDALIFADNGLRVNLGVGNVSPTGFTVEAVVWHSMCAGWVSFAWIAEAKDVMA